MAEGDDNKLEIKVLLPNGGEPVKLKVKKDTKMDRVFVAIAGQLGVEKQELRFLFDGKPISGDITPKMLEMEDEDQIDCMTMQTGGCK
mmetsp:Transcript_9961/g.9682  ORF Transcript_9961/g.9682 Transcript_9961/m.9682 type:complete len:88 (-) Transcript_9961:423-686(-)|eukprot:CAMPEP_0119052486 /NCGR_PEP_ID=MMETSP1177-20130426/73767_1 /TAXON_ID=2985 /ORGANISM="Ochromonas sp, Strain CCMP1899" /LENGTH=87 /DNA_ID=CAMNT_0007032071 /DNA_START=520 /DNA_END=783 /DNA_ORIENTATION=+